MTLSFKNIALFGGLLLMVSAGLGFVSGGNDPAPAPVTAPEAPSRFMVLEDFTVKSKDSSITFDLGREVKGKKFVAAAILVNKVSVTKTSGSNSMMAALMPDKADRFAKKYPGTKICPAPFFNRHAQHIDLYAADAVVAAKLKKWHRNKYTDASKWENVSITGRCVGKMTELIVKGKDVTDRTRISRNKGRGDCLRIWVKSIDVVPANLVSVDT